MLRVLVVLSSAASVHGFQLPLVGFRAPVTHPLARLPASLAHGSWPVAPVVRTPTISTTCSAGRTSPRISAAITPDTRRQESTAVYALLVLNIALFVTDKVLRLGAVRQLYLYHAGWRWWQPLSATFCHANRAHLSGNAFLLLLFGRSVEDELGWAGLVLSYAFCGIFANLASLVLLPASTVVRAGARRTLAQGPERPTRRSLGPPCLCAEPRRVRRRLRPLRRECLGALQLARPRLAQGGRGGRTRPVYVPASRIRHPTRGLHR